MGMDNEYRLDFVIVCHLEIPILLKKVDQG